MYDSANEEQLRPYAERIAKLIGVETVEASPRNPVPIGLLTNYDVNPEPHVTERPITMEM